MLIAVISNSLQPVACIIYVEAELSSHKNEHAHLGSCGIIWEDFCSMFGGSGSVEGGSLTCRRLYEGDWLCRNYLCLTLDSNNLPEVTVLGVWCL